jgi:hypothetical protein
MYGSRYLLYFLLFKINVEHNTFPLAIEEIPRKRGGRLWTQIQGWQYFV